ncbi:MAG: hypothetical protein PHU72_09310 [Dethiosulfovibrio sp.]|nr:hypothetical protein [Dethiosulfovibrio sp.]
MNFKRMTIAAISVMLTFAVFSVSYGDPLDAENPRDNDTNVPTEDLTLEWKGIEGYSYEVLFGTKTSPLESLEKNLKEPKFTPPNVEPSTTYRWQIKATSPTSPDVKSSVWRFTTAEAQPISSDVGPATPKFPADKASDVPFGEVTLVWDCTVKGVTFDLYFGSNAASLEMVIENTTNMLHDVTTSGGGKYFWQIVVKDSEGNETRSPVWSFTTKGDDSIGGGCTISSSPFSLLLGIPLIMINKISR